jgi:hypothetical protein
LWLGKRENVIILKLRGVGKMWLKRILISIGILAAVGAGSFILYNVAYAVGDVAG